MNFLENYERLQRERKEKKADLRLQLENYVCASIYEFESLMVDQLNVRGKATLEIKNIDGAGIMMRRELGDHIVNIITQVFNGLNVECNVWFRTYMTDEFKSVRIVFSVRDQVREPGVLNSRRYVYEPGTGEGTGYVRDLTEENKLKPYAQAKRAKCQG